MAYVQVDLVHVACPTCGLSYGLTEHHHKYRSDDGREMYCPNGHKWWYIVKGEKTRDGLIEENKELTQRAFQAEHRIEQLEAKVRDLQGGAKTIAVKTDAVEVKDYMEVLENETHRPYLCTGCGKQYTSAQWLIRHITKQHDVRPEVQNVDA